MPDWGASDLVEVGSVRTAYIHALQQADNHSLAPLLDFMWPVLNS